MDGACTEGPVPRWSERAALPADPGPHAGRRKWSGASALAAAPDLQIALVGCQVRLPSGARLPASSPVLSSLFSHTPTPTLYQLCP